MLYRTNENVNSATECWKSRISYIKEEDVISIEHFSETGALLSEVKMNYEDAISYARIINDIVDKALDV